MNTSQILLFALLLILLYLVYTYFIKGSSNKLTSLLPAGSPYVASEETIRVINNSQDVYNYTVSVWIYIDNWDITPDLTKPILKITDALDIYLGGVDNNLFVDIHPFHQSTSSSSETFSNIYPLNPANLEGLTPMNITAKKKSKETMQNLDEGFYGKVSTSANVKKYKEGIEVLSSSSSLTSSSIEKFTAVVPSIPLQSWNNITVSIHDKAIDI